MQIVDYDRYRVLIKKKTLHCSSCTHLDGLRIGLRIKKNIIRAPSVIKDLENIESQNWDKLKEAIIGTNQTLETYRKTQEAVSEQRKTEMLYIKAKK